MNLLQIVFGLGLSVGGVFAYLGRWRGWAERSAYGYCGGFATLFIGLAMLIPLMYRVFPSGSFGHGVLIYLWLPPLVVGVIGYWWMPKFLLPRWFVTEREEQRRLERSRRAARRARRA